MIAAMTRRERDALRRERVWLSLPTGVVHPGVVIWRAYGLVRVMYWDIRDDRNHYALLFRPSADVLTPREEP